MTQNKTVHNKGDSFNGMARKNKPSNTQILESNKASGELCIDLGAIFKNYCRIRDAVHPAECAAVIKADAYGLGAEYVAPALYKAGCRKFFVAQLSEALALRQIHLPNTQIIVLNGIETKDMRMAQAYAISPVLNTLEQAIAWIRSGPKHEKNLLTVLQIDTGMTRFGLHQSELTTLATLIESEPLASPDILLSHLSCADSPSIEYCEQQRKQFQQAQNTFPSAKLSLSNSAGAFMGPAYTLDLCRLGAALLGIKVSPRAPLMHPVVQLNLRVAQVQEVPAGVYVGYGGEYRTSRTTRIATISAGYADGIPRNLTSQAGVWLESQKMPLSGRVCMDSFMVDATDMKTEMLKEGQVVEFIGPNQTLEAVGSAANTIAYEILTRLGRRYSRKFLSPASNGIY